MFLLTGTNYEIYILKADVISKEQEIKELKEKLAYLENELKRSNNILSNENFLKKAPAKKVLEEKAKQENYQSQYNLVKEALENLC